jgi:hypothetical protein
VTDDIIPQSADELPQPSITKGDKTLDPFALVGIWQDNSVTIAASGVAEDTIMYDTPQDEAQRTRRELFASMRGAIKSTGIANTEAELKSMREEWDRIFDRYKCSNTLFKSRNTRSRFKLAIFITRCRKQYIYYFKNRIAGLAFVIRNR